MVGAGLTALVSSVTLARAGHHVDVIEALAVGALATGNTTAKRSLVEETQLQEVARVSERRIALAYLAGKRAGFDRMLDYAGQNRIPVQRRPAISMAMSNSGASTLQRKYEIAPYLDLPVRTSSSSAMPFRTYRSVMLPDLA